MSALFGALGVLLPTFGAAQAFTSQAAHTDDGTFVVAGRSTISVYELAAAWAPVLWFSDYEPLLDRRPLPTRMPIDPAPTPPGKGVVYYRATVVTPESGLGFPEGPLAAWDLATSDAASTEFEPFPACKLPPTEKDQTPDCLHLGAIDLIRLQYLFYLEEDVGGGGHTHDLEIAELWFRIVDQGGGLHRVGLDQILGYAHGHKGYANKLDLRAGEPSDPLTVPIVLLIERGKHAPTPDPTADGRFTPGFDVNDMVADAWGVRDVFTSSWVGVPAYASWMTLGREQSYVAHYGALPIGNPNAWGYELRDFKRAATASVIPIPDDLLVYLVYHDYLQEPQNGPPRIFGLRDRFGLGGRIDLGLGPYVSWMGPELPYIGGHPVLTAVGGLTFEGSGGWLGVSGLYSPMIATFYNVYGGVTWMHCPSCTSGAGVGPEAGIKIRIPIPHPPAPDFFGVRIGLRYASFYRLGSPRLLLELGLATP